MIDNQLAAQLLLSHQLASREQILSVWPSVTAEKDVGMLLVEKGFLPEPTYAELLAYMGSLAKKVPEPQTMTDQPADPPAAADPSGEDMVEENWIPVLEEESPEARKTSRAEHAQRKRMAEAPPPKAKNLSAISQYRESIPTASGAAFPTAQPPPPPPLPPPSASACGAKPRRWRVRQRPARK